MKKLLSSLSASLPLVLIIGSNSPSIAQNVFGGGPTNILPNFSSGQQFQLDSGVSCPTPSINVSGFGGTANNFADASSFANSGFGNNNSNSGANNYGVAIGLNIPLGGRYAQFCRDFAEAQTLDLQKRLEITESQFQSQLVQQCYYLFSIYINFNDKYYDEDGPGKALFPCREIVKTINPPNPSTPIPTPDKNKQPEFSDPAPLRSRPLLTEPIR